MNILSDLWIMFLVNFWKYIIGGACITNPNTVDLAAVCPCEYRFDPVCGSDNITYFNRCILNCNNEVNKNKGYASVSEKNKGECSNKCICQDIKLPVCTLDGETYPNECKLFCENKNRINNNVPILYLAFRSICNGDPCGCSNIAAPVCGTNNIIYRNKCVLNCASKHARQLNLPEFGFKNFGACLDQCLCPSSKDRVCGSDGKIYGNICKLECQNRNIKSSKITNIKVVKKNYCNICTCNSLYYSPVCGSDGRTYPSSCELDCTAKRQNNSFLNVVSKGQCPKYFCSDEYDPVCGSDHRTYNNECELRYFNENLISDNDFIGIFHYGPCQPYECDCSYCPTEYEPVCGNSQQTYWNMCWLNCNADCYKRSGQKQIYLTQQGACSM